MTQKQLASLEALVRSIIQRLKGNSIKYHHHNTTITKDKDVVIKFYDKSNTCLIVVFICEWRTICAKVISPYIQHPRLRCALSICEGIEMHRLNKDDLIPDEEDETSEDNADSV